MNVLVVDPLPPPLVDAIRAALGAGAAVTAVPDGSDTALSTLGATAEAALVAHRQVGAREFASMPRLRFLQRLGAGYDNIDLATARAVRVTVAVTPGANAISVAEHTVMLLLAVLKRLEEAASATRAGGFPTAAFIAAPAGDLGGAVVGLVGTGAIASATAERLRPFGCRLLCTSRRPLSPEREAALGMEWRPFDDLLAEADAVSVHVPLTPETRGMFDRSAFARMKPGSVLVNTSRGEVIDETALREAVASGRLAGAGLDVVAAEADERNPFADLPQVLVTPHYAGATRGAQRRILGMAMANLRRVMEGVAPEGVVEPREF